MNELWQQRRSCQSSARNNDHRSPYQRDRARILHSAAFRRLQAKTQVLGVGMSDFYRTRLTHSLEVSQIGGGILAQLRQKFPDALAQLHTNGALIESLCLAHDIGHPPFGHGGEIALNYKMREHGGFEGNGQTFRIISKLEPYTQHFGMNLSRRTVLGLVKYPATLSQLTNTPMQFAQQSNKHLKAHKWHPAKGIYDDDLDVMEWLLAPLSQADRDNFTLYTENQGKHHKTRFKSFDCSMMELADDIAYGVHDLEDAIVMGIVKRDDFVKDVITPLSELGTPWAQQMSPALAETLFDKRQYVRKDAIGAMVNALITSCEVYRVEEVSDVEFESPLLAFNARLSAEMEQVLGVFKRFVYQHVIQKPELQLLEYKGQQIVMELFDVYSTEPKRFLPEEVREDYQRNLDQGGDGFRQIADFISSMTDEYASRLYRQLFMPESGQQSSFSVY